jgi:hypothetical protein
MRRLPLTTLLVAFAFFSPRLAAQRLPEPQFTQGAAAGPAKATPVYPTDNFDHGKAALAGVLGSATGLVAGALIGHQFDTRSCDDICMEFALVGAFVGETIGGPLAVHLSNDRRGRLGPAVLASFGIGLVGSLAAAGALHDAKILLTVPVLQIASAVAIEQRTARD